jgi:hypothetical protein
VGEEHAATLVAAPGSARCNKRERCRKEGTYDCHAPLACLPALLSPHAYGKDLDGCSHTQTLTRLL